MTNKNSKNCHDDTHTKRRKEAQQTPEYSSGYKTLRSMNTKKLTKRSSTLSTEDDTTEYEQTTTEYEETIRRIFANEHSSTKKPKAEMSDVEAAASGNNSAGSTSSDTNSEDTTTKPSWFSYILRKDDSVVVEQEHLGEGRQYWRDIILGVNDGLVSTFLLVAGVTGANLSNKDILLTAVSGTIAGAISMAAGEFVATKSQQEVMDGEIALERLHIAYKREEELAELIEAFSKIGIPEDSNNQEVESIRTSLLSYYRKNDEAHLQVQTVLEHGVIEEEKRSPYVAGGVAFFLFFFGALPSVIPFACTTDNRAAFFGAGAATIAGLFLVGAAKTWATRGSWYASAIENLLIAAGGGGIAYAVGVIFEKVLRDD